MSRSVTNFIFILLTISKVVLNQGYQEDYAHYEGQDHQEYPSIEENHWDYTDQGRAVRPNPRGITDIFSSKPKADDIAIINGGLGIIAGGKCLIKCVLSITKICTKIFDCLGTCLLPKKMAKITFPRIKKQDGDSDIKPSGRYSHSSDLTPDDISKLFDCLSKCVTKHLPKSVDTLFDWLSCITNRCICYG